MNSKKQLMLVIAEMVSYVEKIFTISCLYWMMLNVQNVQRALAGKCLNFLFTVVHHGQLFVPSLFFFFFRHADVWWNLADWGGGGGHFFFYYLLLLKRTRDVMDERIDAIFGRNLSNVIWPLLSEKTYDLFPFSSFL